MRTTTPRGPTGGADAWAWVRVQAPARAGVGADEDHERALAAMRLCAPQIEVL